MLASEKLENIGRNFQREATPLLVWLSSWGNLAIIVRGGMDDAEWVMLATAYAVATTAYVLWFWKVGIVPRGRWANLAIMAMVASIAICIVMGGSNYTDHIEEAMIFGRTFSKGFYLMIASVCGPVYPILRMAMDR